jgi:hypothetical protein
VKTAKLVEEFTSDDEDVFVRRAHEPVIPSGPQRSRGIPLQCP